MAERVLERIGVVAYATWWGSVSGRRGVGLAVVAATYPLLVLALGVGRSSTVDLVGASEFLYSVLFLPILLLLVCLVLGVALFRGELEDDTLIYPVTRSLPRPALVLGKYLGFLGAALAVLLPAALLGPLFGILLNVGPTSDLGGVGVTLIVTTVLATMAYGAFFLLVGLLTRSALVIGLLYGFLWETFVPVLPGPLKEVTLVYYFRAIAARLAPASGFSGGAGAIDLPTAVLVPLGFALATLACASVYFARAELRPAASPA